jgi:hypothetical protein
MTTRIAGAFLAVLLAGCASGPHYWTKPGATAEMFKADHEDCVRGATIGYGVGSERAYKACLSQKDWVRIQGRGTQPPSVPHFRGIEGDDEFAQSAPEQLKDQMQRDQGRERISGEAYQCARGPRLFAASTAGRGLPIARPIWRGCPRDSG